MNSLPFSQPGNWYRGNLHTHSSNSDGNMSPREVCAAYRRRGYHFISLTDHFKEDYGFPISDTAPYRSAGFTTIFGAELHAPKTSRGDLWHILAVGLPLEFKPTAARETGPQVAARAAAAGAYVVVAHPAWYDLTDRDVLAIKAAHAIEIFNTTCFKHNGKGDSVGYLDRLLSQGHRYHAIATDDTHFMETQPDTFENWVMVRARALAPEVLLEALHGGHFYSSQGPEIRTLKQTGQTLRLTMSPVRQVQISSRSFSSACFNAKHDITEARIDISAIKGDYVRVTVVDKRGRKAWTNPIWR